LVGCAGGVSVGGGGGGVSVGGCGVGWTAGGAVGCVVEVGIPVLAGAAVCVGLGV